MGTAIYYKQKINRLWFAWRRQLRLVALRWRKLDRHYGVWWRLGNGAAAVLILASVAIPVLQQVSNSNRYKLSADALSVVGKTEPALAKQLTYDSQTSTYQFNKDGVKSSSGNPLDQLKSQVGTASGSKNDKSLYALDVPADLSKGVTYHDINSQLSFSLVPQFKGLSAKTEQGHIVFPLDGGSQAVYTLKNNGLKEDIVVPKATSDTLTFSYELNLPKTLEAKVIPSSNGAIGIYSADPSLFGNISYGSDKDHAAIQKARENAAKTNLVFGLPSPIIKGADDTAPAGTSARFILNGNLLSVEATGLSHVSGPVSIDPSVVITSTSDFQTAGNNEDNIDFSTAGQITRAGLTGGTLGTWTTNTNSVQVARYSASTVAYNGYMYIMGGAYGSTSFADVNFAPINASTGAVGAWHYTHNSTDDGTTVVAGFNIPRYGFGAVAYNGYMYIMGGTNGSSYYNDVQYAPINADGTIGTWTTGTNSLLHNSYAPGAVAHNGYMYVMGGVDGSTYYNDVQYAPINADGTLGSWHYTHNSTNDGTSFVAGFTSARNGMGAIVDNGFVYIIGGTNGSSYYNDVQYAPINADGTIGTWATSTSFTTARSGLGAVVSNGYVYIMGGFNGGWLGDTQYAPIKANGTLGSWNTTKTFTTSRFSMGSVAYNGYIYITNGYLSTGIGGADIQYAKIDTAGTTTAYAQASGYASTSSRQGNQTVAYNGHLYVMGGDNGSTPVAAVQAATINSDGSLSAFSGTGYTNFTGVRDYFAAVAYNGYMYVMGGCSQAYGGNCSGSGLYNLNNVYSAPIAADGTIGSWTAQSTFSAGRYGISAVAYNGYLYIIGGVQSGTTFMTDVQYHAIGASGALSGSWTTSTHTLSTGMAYTGVAVNGNTLYVAGGCTAGPLTCTSTTNHIYYAPIGGSGDLSANFTTNTTSFTTARGDLGMYISSGYMYITGGRTNTTYYADTQYAPLNADGSVGTWATSNAGVLPTGRAGFGSAVYNGVLYTAGGYNGSTYYANVQYAAINNGGNGTAGTWNAGSSFMNARVGHGSVAYNGYLYVIGGEDSTPTYYNDVQYASINADGTVGTWQYTYNSASSSSFIGGFTNPRLYVMALAYNGYMYIMSGQDASGNYNDVQYAPINSNGTVGTWQYTYNSASSSSFIGGFTTARYGNAAAVYNGYLYIMGGYGTSFLNDVQYAPINSNGTVGTWQYTYNSASSSSFIGGFTTARNGLNAVVYNGFLYMLGGASSTSTFLNDVQYAPINSNGTLGTWQATTSFTTGRAFFSIAASNGYLYILSGTTQSWGALQNDVQYAPINSNGTLGTWTTTTSFTTARDGPTSAIVNGYLYIIGGSGGLSGSLNDVQYASLNSIARTAHYSKLIDLGSSMNITGLTYNGMLPGGKAAISYRSAGSNGVFGTTALGSQGIAATACSSSLQARYVLLMVALDDSQGTGTGGSFPDMAGTNANMTDISVNYLVGHPAPSIRLRAGQTLQSGTLSALDTCYP